MQAAKKLEYDLSIYEPRPEKPVRKKTTEHELVVIKKKENRKKALIASRLRAAGLLVLLVAMFGAVLYSNAILTEMNDRFNVLSEKADFYASENKKLSAEIESKMSYRSVEDIAVASLGLSKIEPYQVEYVDMGVGDKIVLTGFSPTAEEAGAVKQTFINIMEYLRIVFNKN